MANSKISVENLNHGLVSQLCQIVSENSGELRQLVVASRSEQQSRRLSHDTSQCQNDTGDDLP